MHIARSAPADGYTLLAATAIELTQTPLAPATVKYKSEDLRMVGPIASTYQVHVGAAKAGIDMMMKNLALEWGPYGIRANSIVPGPIEGTEGMKRLIDPAAAEQYLAHVPLRRMGISYS